MLAAGGLLPGSFASGIGVQFRLPIKVRIGIGSISPFSSAMSCETDKSCSPEAMLGDRNRGDNCFHRSRTFLSQKSKGEFMRVRMVIAFVVLAATSLIAQTFRGTILGTVTDPSGAVVAGAKVTAKNVNTGLERTTQTSADGSYSIPELPIGTYTVTISQTGFRTSSTTGVIVDVATERRVDAALKTGSTSETVEVSGELLPQIETTSAQLGGTLTTQTIENLPLNGRDFQKLIFLTPGVSGSPDQIT